MMVTNSALRSSVKKEVITKKVIASKSNFCEPYSNLENLLGTKLIKIALWQLKVALKLSAIYLGITKP